MAAAAAMKHMASNFAKLDKFEGADFRRWQKKIHFLLSSMSRFNPQWLNTVNDNIAGQNIFNKSLQTYESLNDGSILHMGNESTALVHGRGCVDLRFSSGKIVSLFNVLHVPNIRKNLVSSSELNNCGYKQVIESNKFVLSKHGVFIGFGYLSNQMFRLNIVNDNIASAFMSTSKLNDLILWHARLGHVHFKSMQDMSKDGLILTFDMDIENYFCNMHATPSLGNKKYFVTFIDDASRTDIGGEYMDILYFQSFGIIHETTALYTPQQDGISERKNRVLKEMVNSMLSYLGLSQGFWGEAMAVVRLPNPKLKTLDERGIECIFIGYAEHSKAFRFYAIEPNVFKAINDEMYSIMSNNTWVLVDLPPGCKPLGFKWIFKRNPKVDGTIKKFKARLVIQGFRQNSWIDYFDTYAPVIRISTIRLLIAMASIHNLIFHQMNVKTTFLNGELDEEVYTNQPQGFIMHGNENKVDLTKEFLSSRFSMKGMKEVDVILGIRIKHESNGIAIYQSHYIKNVLKKFNYFDCTLWVKLCRYQCNPVLEVYTDASWIRTHEDNSLVAGYSCLVDVYTSGCVFLLSGGVISWASKKQTCITGSTMESEFVTLAAAGKEAEWFKNLLLEIPLWSKPIAPISI
ncbi:zinc finger, CCHC-type containing protein [Tanacetum coccineum]